MGLFREGGGGSEGGGPYMFVTARGGGRERVGGGRREGRTVVHVAVEPAEEAVAVRLVVPPEAEVALCRPRRPRRRRARRPRRPRRRALRSARGITLIRRSYRCGAGWSSLGGTDGVAHYILVMTRHDLLHDRRCRCELCRDSDCRPALSD